MNFKSFGLGCLTTLFLSITIYSLVHKEGNRYQRSTKSLFDSATGDVYEYLGTSIVRINLKTQEKEVMGRIRTVSE
jgi:hypothetical protein